MCGPRACVAGRCYRDVDRQTIFGIVETAGDGHVGFTEAVRDLARAAGESLGEEMPPSSPTSPATSNASPSPKRAATSPSRALRKRATFPTPPPSPAGQSATEDVDDVDDLDLEASRHELKAADISVDVVVRT